MYVDHTNSFCLRDKRLGWFNCVHLATGGEGLICPLKSMTTASLMMVCRRPLASIALEQPKVILQILYPPRRKSQCHYIYIPLFKIHYNSKFMFMFMFMFMFHVHVYVHVYVMFMFMFSVVYTDENYLPNQPLTEKS